MRLRRSAAADADETDSGTKKPSIIASGAAGLVGLAAGSYLTNQILALRRPNPYHQQPYQHHPYRQPYPQVQPLLVQPAYNPYQQYSGYQSFSPYSTASYQSFPSNPTILSSPGNTYGIGGSQAFSTGYYPSSSYTSAYGRQLQSGNTIGNGQYASDGVRLWLVSYNQNQSQGGTRKPQQAQQQNSLFGHLTTNGYVSYFGDGVRLTKRK